MNSVPLSSKSQSGPTQPDPPPLTHLPSGITYAIKTFLNSFFLMLSQIIVAQQCSDAAGLKPTCMPPASATSSLLINALV